MKVMKLSIGNLRSREEPRFVTTSPLDGSSQIFKKLTDDMGDCPVHKERHENA